MTKDEIRALLADNLEKEGASLEVPTPADWEALRRRFQTVFPEEFVSFMELMSEFAFPGDIYNVARLEKNNGNDLITEVYDIERQAEDWPPDLIPFYGIGNGDYFAISATEGKQTAVYYRYHEDGHVEKYKKSFEDWVNDLPAFLRGEA